MGKFHKSLSLTFMAWLVLTVPGTAFSQTQCIGREFPAKVIITHARSAEVDVNLGFGLTYRDIIELDGTKEPNKPLNEWYGKASEALLKKIGGKQVTLCVVDGEGKRAYFYVDGVNINKQMIAEGLLGSRPFPPFGVSTSF
jgi:hypothetical protein